jgi:hypothetical protein
MAEPECCFRHIVSPADPPRVRRLTCILQPSPGSLPPLDGFCGRVPVYTGPCRFQGKIGGQNVAVGYGSPFPTGQPYLKTPGLAVGGRSDWRDRDTRNKRRQVRNGRCLGDGALFEEKPSGPALRAAVPGKILHMADVPAGGTADLREGGGAVGTAGVRLGDGALAIAAEVNAGHGLWYALHPEFSPRNRGSTVLRPRSGADRYSGR